MNAHTPGPWVAHKVMTKGSHSSAAFYILASGTKDLRSPAVAHIKRSTVQPMGANARLIAAAPALLAALLEARAFLSSDYVGRNGKDLTGGALPRIDAAIAMASANVAVDASGASS